MSNLVSNAVRYLHRREIVQRRRVQLPPRADLLRQLLRRSQQQRDVRDDLRVGGRVRRRDELRGRELPVHGQRDLVRRKMRRSLVGFAQLRSMWT